MRSYSSREVIQIIEADGWIHFDTHGDHWYYKHPIKTGKVTVTHPEKDILKENLKSIFKQAGFTREEIKDLLWGDPNHPKKEKEGKNDG
ncbi:MAG: type II toxin-antitoxin system HicA family toxin [Bacillota bacterium]